MPCVGGGGWLIDAINEWSPIFCSQRNLASHTHTPGGGGGGGGWCGAVSLTLRANTFSSSGGGRSPPAATLSQRGARRAAASSHARRDAAAPASAGSSAKPYRSVAIGGVVWGHTHGDGRAVLFCQMRVSKKADLLTLRVVTGSTATSPPLPTPFPFVLYTMMLVGVPTHAAPSRGPRLPPRRVRPSAAVRAPTRMRAAAGDVEAAPDTPVPQVRLRTQIKQPGAVGE